MKKTLYEIELRGDRLFLIHSAQPRLEVDVTGVWHFVKDGLLNLWSVEDFIKEKDKAPKF